MWDDPPERYDPRADRLLRLEMAVQTLRRRFWWALAGYLIMAVGLVAAFYVSYRIVEEGNDDTRALCQTVRELSDERKPCR